MARKSKEFERSVFVREPIQSGITGTKFVKNPEFSKLYKDFKHEYLTLGHMKKVVTHLENNCQYYLPHHGVIQNTSSTTKLRVVFDSYAKTTTGKSLNDCLAVGPNLQLSLYE